MRLPLAGTSALFCFRAKLRLLCATLDKGHGFLVIVAVINAAIAVYYYLCVVREACFRDAGERPPIRLDWATRALCVLLIGGILALGIAPSRILNTLSSSVVNLNSTTPATAVVDATR